MDYDFDYETDYDGDDGSDEQTDYEVTNSTEYLDSTIGHDSVNFRGGNEKSLQYDLRQAQKNVDYYQHEIENFTDNTTETYKNNCKSHLKKALEKVKDISEELEKLNSK